LAGFTVSGKTKKLRNVMENQRTPLGLAFANILTWEGHYRPRPVSAEDLRRIDELHPDYPLALNTTSPKGFTTPGLREIGLRPVDFPSVNTTALGRTTNKEVYSII
jgi:hypothetical protein